MVRSVVSKSSSHWWGGTVGSVLPTLKTLNRPNKNGLWAEFHWKDPTIVPTCFNVQREGWWQASKFIPFIYSFLSFSFFISCQYTPLWILKRPMCSPKGLGRGRSNDRKSSRKEGDWYRRISEETRKIETKMWQTGKKPPSCPAPSLEPSDLTTCCQQPPLQGPRKSTFLLW